MFTATTLNRRSYRTQNVARAVFFLMTVTLVIPVLIIVGTLVVKGGPAISWEFLFTAPQDGMTAGGIFPALVGTVWLVAVALLASVPVGVAAALYLSEYAPDNLLTRSINLAIINLAGVPSIVHALFGVGAFVLFFNIGASILAASLTLAVMTLPVVIVATRESLQAVPQAFREACWNMGATRWQTIRKVVLPNSISGILTGVILEVSRTAGETAPIMFTGAAAFVAFLPVQRVRPDDGHVLPSVLHRDPADRRARGDHLRRGPGTDFDCAADERDFDRLQGLPARPEEMVDGSPAPAPATVSGGTSPLYGEPPIIEVRGLTIAYDGQPALRDISLDIFRHEIFGIIGPANSGKTSFLRALNRMDGFNPGMDVRGSIRLHGKDINDWRNVYALRSRIGVVFPLPVGLPLTVYDNVAFSPRLRGIRKKAELDEVVERCLTRAALWDEVKDRLDSLGSLLSGGQQQRLTIARALSQEPELLLLDEFSIAVDPVTTMRIEDVLRELRSELTIVLVTNLVQQARRLADRTAFFLMGEMVEIGVTEDLFERKVSDERTTGYIEGRYG